MAQTAERIWWHRFKFTEYSLMQRMPEYLEEYEYCCRTCKSYIKALNMTAYGCLGQTCIKSCICRCLQAHRSGVQRWCKVLGGMP